MVVAVGQHRLLCVNGKGVKMLEDTIDVREGWLAYYYHADGFCSLLDEECKGEAPTREVESRGRVWEAPDCKQCADYHESAAERSVWGEPVRRFPEWLQDAFWEAGNAGYPEPDTWKWNREQAKWIIIKAAKQHEREDPHNAMLAKELVDALWGSETGNVNAVVIQIGAAIHGLREAREFFRRKEGGDHA